MSLLLLLALSQNTATDRWLMASSSALIVADWSLTIDGVRRVREGYSESNPILGRYPSVGRVNTLIGLGLLGNVLASQLPKAPRRIIWVAVIVAETHAVWFNRTRGLRFSARF